MIVERLIFAASRGFAVDLEGFKTIMVRVAAGVRAGWKHGVPSDNAVRSLGTRHRDITFKKSENKEYAKLRC